MHTLSTRQLSVGCKLHSGLPHLDGDAFGRFAHTFLGLFYLIQTTMQVSACLSSPCTLPGINGQNDESERVLKKRFDLFEDAIFHDNKFSPVTSSRMNGLYLPNTFEPIFRQGCLRYKSLRYATCTCVRWHIFRKRGILDCSLTETNCLYLQIPPRESEERFQQAGVKCKRRETHVRRSARARALPPPSKRNLADTMEYRIFNTPPGNAKRGARQWLFLGTDSRSFISIRRFLYMNRYAAVVVDVKTRHLRRENRERIHYVEVSAWRPLDPRNFTSAYILWTMSLDKVF